MRRSTAKSRAGAVPAIATSIEARKGRRAAAATEFALTLPLLLLVAFGCAELGRAVAIYTMVSCAARAGAEYGATHGYTNYTYASWQSQVTQHAQTAVQGNSSFNSNLFSIVVNTTAEAGGFNLTTVTANYQFSTITQWPGLPHQFTITHAVGMRRYR
jgi:Flp pilus assembly protein TadG